VYDTNINNIVTCEFYTTIKNKQCGMRIFANNSLISSVSNLTTISEELTMWLRFKSNSLKSNWRMEDTVATPSAA